MKVIDKINGSGLFAQSALSASIATKDSLGRDITATYLTGIDISNYYTKDETSGAEQLAQAFAAIPSDVATTGDVANLEQTISETYYPKSNPSSFATESWVTSQGFLTAHQDISNKLDSSAFSSVSGDFLTTSFSIPESATWNDTSNVVQTNSAQWAEGGGGSVSSKYGTISVDGSNIEATNKALEFKSNGFTSSFGRNVMITSTQKLNFSWDNYSQGTSLTISFQNVGDESKPLTYSSNTNVTGEITAAPNVTIHESIQIPNATSFQFTTDGSYLVNSIEVSAPSSFKVKELAWKSDIPTYTYNSANKLSAINGSALVGNEDYLLSQGFVQNLTSPKGTISVLNNNKIEGTNSAIASDVIEGFVSAYNGLSVYPGHSATLTWDRYVPNTILHVSGAQWSPITLTYSADTGVTGQINLPNEGETSIEVPTNATSIVIGNESWNNINQNFTVSAADNYEIGELAWASAIPTYEYDSTNKISAINGSALAGGGDVPSGTMNVSGLEYNAVNEISGYNGSAIAQYGAEKQWLVHDDTLVHASNSAQYALGVNVSALQRLMGIDETVLFSGEASTAITLSESPLNFTKIRVYTRVGATVGGTQNFGCGSYSEFLPYSDFNYALITGMFAGTSGSEDNIYNVATKWAGTSGKNWSRTFYGFRAFTATGGYSTAGNWNSPYLIVGIGRKA